MEGSTLVRNPRGMKQLGVQGTAAGLRGSHGGLGRSRVRGGEGHKSLERSGKKGNFPLRSHGRVTEGSQAGGRKRVTGRDSPHQISQRLGCSRGMEGSRGHPRQGAQVGSGEEAGTEAGRVESRGVFQRHQEGEIYKRWLIN